MPKFLKTNFQKSSIYVKKYPKEYIHGPNETLFCNICACTVDASRKSIVESHRATKKHKNSFSLLNEKVNSKKEQQFFGDKNPEISKMIIEAFLQADIPLEKLKNKNIKHLFSYLKVNVPSVSTARRTVKSLATKHFENLKKFFIGKQVFLIVDETEIKDKKYFNILCGSIEDTTDIKIIECIQVDGNINSLKTETFILDALERYNIKTENFMLLISDAASYMVLAGKRFKQSNSIFYHVTCMAHLLHNCAIKLKSYFADVNYLISAVQMAIIKNKSRKESFYRTGYPPNVIITRWSSWLKASLWYADNLPAVIEIVESWDNDGILVFNSKNSIHSTTVFQSLCVLKSNYEILVNILDDFEHSKYNMETGLKKLQSISFKYDPVGLKDYIDARLDKNDIVRLVNSTEKNISPSMKMKLINCPPTSVSVERSFSMLKKMLARDRNFVSENILDYFYFYYNTSIAFDDND
jgi:hypothetical protein